MILHRGEGVPPSGVHSLCYLRYRPPLSTEERLEEANRHIEKNPTDVQALLRRAKLFVRLEDHQAAQLDLSVIIDLPRGKSQSSELVCAFFLRGVCHVKLSWIDKAIADFTAALDIDPSHSRSTYERAACHNRKGNYTAAILDYERALQHDSMHVSYFSACHRNARSRFAKTRPHQRLSLRSFGAIEPSRRDASSLLNVDGVYRNGDNGKRPPPAPPHNMYVKTSGLMAETSRLSHSAGTPIGSPERHQIVPAVTSSSALSGNEEAELHQQRGLAYRKKGDYLRAIDEYSAALRLDPKNFKALFNRGFCNDKVEDYNAAIRDYEAAMKLEPGYAYTYYNLGISYDRWGGHYKEAIAMFDKAIALDGNNADFYHNRGFSQRKLGKYREAVKDYTMALSLDPQHFKAYYNRAFCYDKLGEGANAIADYTKAIAIQDDNPNAYHNRGAAMEKAGRLDDAIADYTRAIQLDDGNPFTYNARGIAYDRRGKSDAALQDLTQAIALSPNNPIFYQNRAFVFQNMERFPEAVRDYNISLALLDEEKRFANGATSEGKATQELNLLILKQYFNRGFCYAREGHYEAAICDFSTVMATNPDNLVALYNRGICHDKVGNYKLAVEDFSHLIELDAENAEAHFSRGTALESLGEYAMALDDYAVAFKLDVDRSDLVDEGDLAKFKSEHHAMVASQRVLRLLKEKKKGSAAARRAS
ncbi:hypothetical protein C3747_28g35 [Trypanosoma cruzi]|uniref:UDP-N-acetylglucosamine--peptide N-acetylglucosaminyltransferase SPINDLY n=2 Tax=Trypanosoma cruzi TaxID=5693 RepID=Q4DCN5_TRYCC|nr:hypothetical protein, conserved [Trypanosoma cruzi]EAN90290.1 hypothetical protein, conserved [Trypanosoma cruzi]PWV15589.1 hypothetical protein C3747_28g35 [Trypanosoma cruzi]RNC61284.1 hypothetical protein TcCL_ESM01050 [Trypanosoma cruzi]|eukprot:XP_812141.1 hypothetical protein [Trypanosoma cruzi strain CL Brener]